MPSTPFGVPAGLGTSFRMFSRQAGTGDSNTGGGVARLGNPQLSLKRDCRCVFRHPRTPLLTRNRPAVAGRVPACGRGRHSPTSAVCGCGASRAVSSGAFHRIKRSYPSRRIRIGSSMMLSQGSWASYWSVASRFLGRQSNLRRSGSRLLASACPHHEAPRSP